MTLSVEASIPRKEFRLNSLHFGPLFPQLLRIDNVILLYPSAESSIFYHPREIIVGDMRSASKECGAKRKRMEHRGSKWSTAELNRA